MTETEKAVNYANLTDNVLQNILPDCKQVFASEDNKPSVDIKSQNLVDVSGSSASNLNADEKSCDGAANKTVEQTLPRDEETTKQEWLDITGSGDFKKKVLKPGLGPETRPQRGQLVTVDADFYLKESLFEEKKNLKFTIGDLDVIQGLELSVCLMEKEERAKIMIPSKLAYGKIGRLPEVPENADIECEVELKEIETVDMNSLSVLERLQVGNEKRERGNEFYERGEYLESIHCYERAAEYLDGIVDCSNNSTEESMEIIETRLKVYNNMAASHMKLNAYASALKSVDLVLKVQPKNVKALFRKAKILGIQGSTEEAIYCIRIAANLEPETKVIQKELTRLLNQKKREDLNQRMMYKKMFPAPEAKKSSTLSKFWKWGMATSGGVAALIFGLAAYRHLHG